MMSEYGQQILTNALELPAMERADLIEQLLSSFEFQSRYAIDALWAQESESRIDAFEDGELKIISAKDVFEKIEQNQK